MGNPGNAPRGRQTLAGERGEERGAEDGEMGVGDRIFLINLARGERIGARIFTHQLSTTPPLLTTFLPPLTQSQRGEGGGQPASRAI